jgi:type VI secretion system secreted protein VgrG
MLQFSQKNRPLQVTTTLGDTTLFVTGFRGHEEISNLFHYELDLIAERSTQIDFDHLIGTEFTLKIATPGEESGEGWRYIGGICSCFSQGDQSEEFTSYCAEVVPKVWLLTRRAQSRIFQQKSVPDIVKEVLGGFDCDYELHGQYEPREYCVQYRETDFDFVSRLMEEEGIYYFFKHTESGHKMVIADTPRSHPDVPGLTNARYGMTEGGARKADHILTWRKSHSIRASKYSLWDHHFQQPTQNLEAKARVIQLVRAGSVEHKLNGQTNGSLEIYDFPGGYAGRFDGVSPSGGDQPARLQKILEDNQRTVKLRMEAETVKALKILGTSNCKNFTAGHKFTLDNHFDADDDYVLVSVSQVASMTNAYTSGSGGDELTYSNSFTCIPLALPFRPERKTSKPYIYGVQNAVVTGPPGEEIFTDKYGRVKVQFYWDRQGKKDANSSCWLRVCTLWAGMRWGSINIPRIGQEVVVAFLEGDPNQPLVVGSAYNAKQMTPYDLPNSKVISGIKSNTHKGKGYNEMSMDDTAGKEKITVHAQYDRETTVEHDDKQMVHHDRTKTIGHDEVITIGHDEVITIDHDQTETVKNNRVVKIVANHTEDIGASMSIVVGSTLTELVGVNHAETVGGAMELTVGAALAITVGAAMAETVGGAKVESVGMVKSENIGGNRSLNVGGNKNEMIAKNRIVSVAKDQKTTIGGQQKTAVTKESILNAKKVQIVAEDEILLKTGSANITLKKSGDILINGQKIEIKGSGDVIIKGSQIKEN